MKHPVGVLWCEGEPPRFGGQGNGLVHGVPPRALEALDLSGGGGRRGDGDLLAHARLAAAGGDVAQSVAASTPASVVAQEDRPGNDNDGEDERNVGPSFNSYINSEKYGERF